MKQDEIERIYQMHSKEIYLYALALCKNVHQAQDLTSDTFFKALLTLDTAATGVKYWLLRVCKNLFIDWHRKRRRETIGLPDEIAHGEGNPLDVMLGNDERRKLYDALLWLSESDRELLTMFYFLDCSIAQIASHFGRTPGAVKTGLCRARTRLKKLLEEETQ